MYLCIPRFKHLGLADFYLGTDKRGVVVKVFRDTQGSSEEDLFNYEQGVFGPILP